MSPTPPRAQNPVASANASARGACTPSAPRNAKDAPPETTAFARNDETPRWYNDMDAATGKHALFSVRIEFSSCEDEDDVSKEHTLTHANDASANAASARAYHFAHSAPATEDETSGKTASGRIATATEPTSSTHAFTRRSPSSLDAFAASGCGRASSGETRVDPERSPAEAARARRASREGARFHETALL